MSLKHDPIEEKEEYKEIFNNIDKEVEEILKSRNVKNGHGYIHIYDITKQKILIEKYGIDWKTTAEMNPDIFID